MVSSVGMFRNRTVTVVIPAYNEEETIGAVVADFQTEPHVDEVVVVDNNCSDDTAAIAESKGARVVREQKPGYGSALLAGMDAAAGDLIVLTEADGSFHARDVIKLLVYLDDAGMVMGTRTTRQLVQQGANMRSFLRWGNVFMAKLLQLCWLRPSEPRFTDVGCTYRALTRDTYLRIRGLLREPGPAFSPEMMCAALQARCRVIEVPVTYSKRLGGDSKHSDTFMRQARTALMMFRTICRKRFLEWRLSGATSPSPATATRADRQAAGDA
jgi:glycosyltransferase involved in cell wall biosynthesis